MDASDRGGLTVSIMGELPGLPGAKLAAVRSVGFASVEGGCCCECERMDCDGRGVDSWASGAAVEVA